MGKIVLSTDKKTWVGRAFYPMERYFSFDSVCFEVDDSDVVLEPTVEQILHSIANIWGIKIQEDHPLFPEFCAFLCNPNLTDGNCFYFYNPRAKYSVSQNNNELVRI